MTESSQAAASESQSAATQSSESAAAQTAAVNPDQAADRNTMTPQQDAASTSQQLDMANLLGEEFAKDPAFKDFKDVKSLAKSFKDTKAMVGNRIGVPAADAPDSVKAEFFKALGVPDAPEGYALAAPAEYPEHMGEYMQDTLAEYSKVAHEFKLSPAQAKGIQGWFDKHAIALMGAQGEASAAAEAEVNGRLNEMFNKQFGDKTGEASARVKATMEKVFPDVKVREDLQKALPNEALLAIAAVEDHYRKTYGQADQNISDEGSTAGKGIEDLRQEAQKIMASDAYRDPMHKDHKATREKANQLYRDIGSMKDAANKKS